MDLNHILVKWFKDFLRFKTDYFDELKVAFALLSTLLRLGILLWACTVFAKSLK